MEEALDLTFDRLLLMMMMLYGILAYIFVSDGKLAYIFVLYGIIAYIFVSKDALDYIFVRITLNLPSTEIRGLFA